MANKVLITGESGSGKTYALRTLDPKTSFIICPDEKNPPFKGWRNNYIMANKEGVFHPGTCNYYKTTKWEDIRSVMKFVSEKRPEIKTIALDTITYAMIGEFMDKAETKGYDKFTQMGSNVYKTLKIIDGLRDDLTVLVLAHTDTESFNGVDKTTFSVPGGKLVKDVVKPVGMFVIALETLVEKKGDDVNYYFMTHNNTTNMAKSPEGMFEAKIPNDMNAVLKAIAKYEND